ncbi:glycosyltransferase family 4 protein [Arenimonas oryziterrae]|uniref:Glycosyl transferase family 1 domain-containing protein n=1 Tax=Arenimonas oryziterrae DSM 21050 = YC6267 TaxID=1121015 RepID=A0A091AUK1_9GAMM|nr:glycosyltransferase family 1 protein [Arenimonas oryziterrae]KFN42912.1 hypothetical protein N789_12365 [Arenimonas oryziterrae DSM 21050 = YC6267]
MNVFRQVVRAMSVLQHPVDPRPRLFVDITLLVLTNTRTGIQRVSRNILQQWLDQPNLPHRVEPVYLCEGVFRLARKAARREFGAIRLKRRDVPMRAKAGDLFLGLELAPQLVAANLPVYEQLRRDGVRIHFVVYDLLPVLHPEWFLASTAAEFRTWVQTVTRVADGLACISVAVSDEVKRWCDQNPPPRDRPLAIGHFPLGADPENRRAIRSVFLPPEAADLLLPETRSVLMVGTIEPRKGHAQALAAFERLWAQGEAIHLIIVGAPGWKSDALIERLKTHPENGHRLVWLPSLDDAGLHALYRHATVLLAASQGEGYGLPIVEAARHGLPILARDIPVFREVAGAGATYFHGGDGASLARALLDWFAHSAAGDAARPERIHPFSWEQSARKLMQVLAGKRIRHVIAAPKVDQKQPSA